jgi:PAS domain S-box-containing protein
MHVMDLIDSRNRDHSEHAELLQLRRFFDLAIDLMAIGDGKGRFLRVNRALQAVLGYSEAELLNHPIWDFLHPDDKQATQGEWARLIEGMPVSYFENRYLTKSGETVWLAWTCYPVPGEDLFYSVARDVTHQKQEQDRLRSQQQVLADLMRHPAIQGGDLPGAMHAITEAAARTLGVARVSVWCYDDSKSVIYCRDLYELGNGAHVSGEELHARDYPTYFEALTKERIVSASDARVDPRTREFADSYFPAHGITSLLDVPIRQRGELQGIICHEHVGPKRLWTAAEEVFAAALGDALALACETHELHMAQDALRKSEERFRYVAFATTDALYDWDIRTGSFWWSEGLRKVSPAASLAESFGIEEWRAHVHPEDRERVWASLQQALDNDVPYWTDEYRFLREGDGYATIREKGYILRNEACQPYRMIGAMEDITERRQAEEARARSFASETAARAEVEAIKELNRLKNHFVNAVSHDLRIPLTSVMGYAEFLEDGMGGELLPQQLTFVDQIQKNTLRLTRLVDDLLDFARMEAGSLKLNLADEDLGARVREVAQSLRPQIEASGLSLELDLPEEPLVACLDGPRIERVFFNLLNNAIKFTPPEGRIQVSLDLDGSVLRAEVRDTGLGIAPDDLAKLFRPFSQLPGAEAKGGTGLGLNIVKVLVEAHCGSVGVDSELGKGSCFWFTLPMNPCPESEPDRPSINTF